MIFNVLTIYKDIIELYAKTGVIGRGCADGAISVRAFDIRDYTLDKHGKVDDTPYGGGAGMVMTPQPVYDCIKAVKKDKNIPVIYFSPRGERFDSQTARDFAEYDEVILLCGHFEGIDQRVIDLCVDREISVGDYILTGGHIAAMTFIDCVARYIPGVLGNLASASDESFEKGLLEYEQYTRPYVFMGKTVPDILLSGNHEKIAVYKKARSLEITAQKRPDLLIKSTAEKKDTKD